MHTLKTPSVERVNLTLTPGFKSVKRSSRLISLATDEVTLSLSESPASDILKAHPANVSKNFRFPLDSSLECFLSHHTKKGAFLITVCDYGASIQTTAGALNFAGQKPGKLCHRNLRNGLSPGALSPNLVCIFLPT